MSFTIKLDHKSPGREDQIHIGTMVRGNSPRNTIEIPVRYRVYRYDEKGSPIVGERRITEYSEGVPSIRSITEHLYQDITKVYTFVRRGGRQAIRNGVKETIPQVQPIRFDLVPLSVYEQMISFYSEWVDIRAAKNEQEYYAADPCPVYPIVTDTSEAFDHLPGARQVHQADPTRPVILPERLERSRETFIDPWQTLTAPLASEDGGRDPMVQTNLTNAPESPPEPPVDPPADPPGDPVDPPEKPPAKRRGRPPGAKNKAKAKK